MAGRSITNLASLGVRFACRSSFDHFIHENGNCGVFVITRRRARHSVVGAEPMCALQRCRSLLPLEGTPRGLKPRRGFVAVDFSRGKASRGWRGDAPGPEDLLGEAFPRQRFLSRPPRPIVWSIAEMLSRAKKPSRGKMSREARQAESLVLSRISCGASEGCGRPAHGTLVSTGPTVAPGP